MLLHHLVANMQTQNAVVVSQKTLAKMMGVHERTVRRAVTDLVEEQWIQVVRIGNGKEAAYVVNDRVAWGQPRDQLRLSVFSAAIVADFEDQDQALLGSGELRKIPTLFPGERQLPTGPGEPPPSQPSIEGLEPDLPAKNLYQAELEKRGQMSFLEAIEMVENSPHAMEISDQNWAVSKDEFGTMSVTKDTRSEGDEDED